MILHDRVREVFESSLRLARESGYLKKRGMRGMRVALDTTNILGRGAVKDTFNLLADGIVKLMRALASVERTSGDQWAQAQGYEGYLGASIKGEAAVDWSSKRERRKLLAEIVADADRLLELARQAQGELPEDRVQRREIVEAAELLGQLLLQDVERKGNNSDGDGGVSLKDGVSRDRMMSVHDPEIRHGHKSSSKRFDGHKAAIVVDTDSQLITAVEVLPGNAPDNLGALELVERSEANTGVPVEESLGDAAYGDGDTRQAFAGAGRTLIARVPGRPNRKHFPKEDFLIDLESGTCTCPAGQVTRKLLPAGKRTGSRGRIHRLQAFRFDAAVYGACPLRPQCVAGSSRKGRTVQLHPQSLPPTMIGGGPVAAGPRPAAERSLCRVPSTAGGGRAPSGPAGAVGDSPGPLLRPGPDEIPVVPGSRGGQHDPAGGQGRFDGRYWQRCPRRPCRQRRRRQCCSHFWRNPARSDLAAGVADAGLAA